MPAQKFDKKYYVKSSPKKRNQEIDSFEKIINEEEEENYEFQKYETQTYALLMQDKLKKIENIETKLDFLLCNCSKNHSKLDFACKGNLIQTNKPSVILLKPNNNHNFFVDNYGKKK